MARLSSASRLLCAAASLALALAGSGRFNKAFCLRGRVWGNASFWEAASAARNITRVAQFRAVAGPNRTALDSWLAVVPSAVGGAAATFALAGAATNVSVDLGCQPRSLPDYSGVALGTWAAAGSGGGGAAAAVQWASGPVGDRERQPRCWWVRCDELELEADFCGSEGETPCARLNASFLRYASPPPPAATAAGLPLVDTACYAIEEDSQVDAAHRVDWEVTFVDGMWPPPNLSASTPLTQEMMTPPAMTGPALPLPPAALPRPAFQPPPSPPPPPLVRAPRSNILLVLADDLETDFKQDRLALMPNLRERVARRGLSFVNHVASTPLCGPSRASLLSGRFAHNHGYLANEDLPSLEAWLAQQDSNLGAWLTAAGYYSAYEGKYVNGLEAFFPRGFRHWAGFASDAGTYNYYNATPYNITFDTTGRTPVSPVAWTAMTGVHQADFLGTQAVAQMRAAAAAEQPFFVFVNPVMIHYGTCYGPFLNITQYARDDPFFELDLALEDGCPNATANQNCDIETSPCASARNAHVADALTNPHTPSWDATATGVVPTAMRRPPSTDYEHSRQDRGFRNRTASAVDLDDMLGVLLDGLDELGVADSTFVIFTSDNGFHLGEHRLVTGKEHPYSTDVRIPLFVRGPGVPANGTRLHPTTLVDLTATIVDLAGAAAPAEPPLDGLSFASALAAAPPAPEQWRNYSFSEHFGGDTTWWLVRRPLSSGGGAAGASAAMTSFAWWCTNESEVFDLAADPWQLANLAGSGPRGDAVANASLAFAAALARCSGANCSSEDSALAPPPPPLAANVLECYKTTRV